MHVAARVLLRLPLVMMAVERVAPAVVVPFSVLSVALTLLMVLVLIALAHGLRVLCLRLATARTGAAVVLTEMIEGIRIRLEIDRSTDLIILVRDRVARRLGGINDGLCQQSRRTEFLDDLCLGSALPDLSADIAVVICDLLTDHLVRNVQVELDR